MGASSKSAFFSACSSGEVEEVAECIDVSKAQCLKWLDDNGQNGLEIASQRGKAKICDLLINSGATLEPNGVTGNTPLHYAAFYGHIRVCHVLLKADLGQLFEQNILGEIPLHLSCKYGQKKVVKQLINIEKRGSFKGSIQMEHQLWKETKTGQTPIEVARQCGHKDIVHYLHGGESGKNFSIVKPKKKNKNKK